MNEERSSAPDEVSSASGGMIIIDDFSNPRDQVIKVSSEYTRADRIGTWKARWGINRMEYTVSPGLYELGEPDENSPVLATANYKMSFDCLRRELQGLNVWILVLDTRGINVWCAAGKGTFGTEELVRRIALAGLDDIVSHRNIILPQLGAPGVAAHQVQKRTGFKVIYGPVRASDLPAFFEDGMKATPEMRTVRFDFMDRLVLTPMELVQVMKPVLVIACLLLILKLTGMGKVRMASLVPYLGAVLVGTVFTPALLPWIPGRAFALKGWLLGLPWAVWMVHLAGGFSDRHHVLTGLSLLLILPAISAYLALNFTGSSTYTSLSGVKKEIKFAVPAIAAFLVCGAFLSLLAFWL